jgi:hypothetical protein
VAFWVGERGGATRQKPRTLLSSSGPFSSLYARNAKAKRMKMAGVVPSPFEIHLHRPLLQDGLSAVVVGTVLLFVAALCDSPSLAELRLSSLK